MPALCLMLLVTYYAFNYAGIIDLGLHARIGHPLGTADLGVKMEKNWQLV